MDVDHTIVHTKFVAITTIRPPAGRVLLRHGLVTAAVMVRPGSREFLEQFAQSHRIVALTLGNTAFQTKVLKRTGLLDLFSQVCGRNFQEKITHAKSFVLLDDDDADSRNVYEKFSWLAVDFPEVDETARQQLLLRHYVQVDRFHGTDEALPFTYLTDLVKAKLEIQATNI